MDAQKKAMVQALEKSLGIVTAACKVVGISRQTHYNWLEDPDYKKAVSEVGDVALDFAESHLHKLIKDDKWEEMTRSAPKKRFVSLWS